MKTRPIIFNSDMIRAILENRKSATRRVIKHAGNLIHIDKLLCDWSLSEKPHQWDGQENIWRWGNRKRPEIGDWIWKLQDAVDDTVTLPIKCPYGKIGDRLWCKETWTKFLENHRPPDYAYKADMKNGVSERCRQDFINAGYPYQWKSSIFMSRIASRITLEITDIRVERVQNISQDDIMAEELWSASAEFREKACIWRDSAEVLKEVREECFADLWDSINAKRGYSWESNPWTWVIIFKRIK